VATTVAATGEGTAGLWSEIERHRDHLAGGELDRSRAERLERQLRAAVAAGVERRAGLRSDDPSYRNAVHSVVARRVDPWTAADRLLDGASPAT
jgi:LAO/AO transport system kinase